MRLLPLLLCGLLSIAANAQTSGRHFHRESRLPATPAASPVTEASATRAQAPLAKLHSGRPWPRHHFGRLPQSDAKVGTARAVDAAHQPGSATRRGFWRARR